MDINYMLWDLIEKVCTKEEKSIMINMPEHEFNTLESTFSEFLEEIETGLNKYR